jgi:hypothetical protein
MKKIVRLTERDLTRIVKRIINEKSELNEGCLLDGTDRLEDLPAGTYKNVTVSTSGGYNCFKLYIDGKIYVPQETW